MKDEKRLNVKLPLAEKMLWQKIADERKVTLTHLIRQAVNKAAKTRPPAAKRTPTKTDPVLLSALARIGNNVNQLARVANSQGDLPTLSALVAIERELKRLRDAG